MSPESAQRAGNEIHRAMNEYVVMPDPPSAEDMLGVPAASTLFELSPGDVVEHYVVAHSDGDLGEFDADSYPPNRGKWVSGEFHAGVVTDPEGRPLAKSAHLHTFSALGFRDSSSWILVPLGFRGS